MTLVCVIRVERRRENQKKGRMAWLHCFNVILRSSHWRCSSEKLFRKYLEENNCAGVFLIKFQVFSLQFYQAETLVHVYFCKFPKILRTTVFTERLQTTASELLKEKLKRIIFMFSKQNVFLLQNLPPMVPKIHQDYAENLKFSMSVCTYIQFQKMCLLVVGPPKFC